MQRTRCRRCATRWPRPPAPAAPITQRRPAWAPRRRSRVTSAPRAASSSPVRPTLQHEWCGCTGCPCQFWRLRAALSNSPSASMQLQLTSAGACLLRALGSSSSVPTVHALRRLPGQCVKLLVRLYPAADVHLQRLVNHCRHHRRQVQPAGVHASPHQHRNGRLRLCGCDPCTFPAALMSLQPLMLAAPHRQQAEPCGCFACVSQPPPASCALRAPGLTRPVACSRGLQPHPGSGRPERLCPSEQGRRLCRCTDSLHRLGPSCLVRPAAAAQVAACSPRFAAWPPGSLISLVHVPLLTV